MSRIRVEVTAEDIAEGVPGNATYCPIALALQRRLDALAGVANDAWGVADEKGHIKGTFPMTARARLFVLAFDRGAAVYPSTFVLEGPIR